MFLYLSILSILTSRMIVFFAISSSSDSLNLLKPTKQKVYLITENELILPNSPVSLHLAL